MSVAELTLRRATRSDAEAISAICIASTRALYGAGDADAAEVRSWFEQSELELVAERDERIVGYADVVRQQDGARFAIDVRIPPGPAGGEIADHLLAAAEDWARRLAEPNAMACGFAAERNLELAGALDRGGYAPSRHSFHMQIALSADLREPSWPDGITVRTYERRDEQAVYECWLETFEDEWDFQPEPIERWRAWQSGARLDPTLWWLAEDADELAGVCLNRWRFGDPTFGWVGTLGVRRPWRRRGLGLAFLRHSFLDFRKRGATKVALSVDAENPAGAVRLYERAGMHVERRNDTYEKLLS